MWLTRSVALLLALLSSADVLYSAGQFVGVPLNHRVTLRLRDGTVVWGKFVGDAESPESVYDARYAAWRGTTLGALDLPARGDSVDLRRGSRVLIAGRFRGFSTGVALMQKSGQAGLVRAAFTDFDSMVVTTGHATSADWLRERDRRGLLPVTNGLRIETPQEIRFLALDEIGAGQIATSSTEKVAGATSGMIILFAILGVAFFAALATAFSSVGK